MGHEDAFPRPRLNARCRFSQRIFAGTRGNGRDAPIPDLPASSWNGEVCPLSSRALQATAMVRNSPILSRRSSLMDSLYGVSFCCACRMKRFVRDNLPSNDVI